MNEKQQQLLFDKGITNVPSDALCSDNALEESLGMVYDNGEHRVIQKPVSYITEAEYTSITASGIPTILYVHKFNNNERFIGYISGGTIVWGHKVNSKFIQRGTFPGLTYASGVQVTSIGKTLVITNNTGIHYYLWAKDSSSNEIYKSLGDSFPKPEVEFKLDGFSTTYKEEEQNCIGMIYGIGDYWDITLGEQENWNNAIIGLFSKAKKKLWQDKKFYSSFCVRVALELYDGSYFHISNPIFMLNRFATYCTAHIDGLEVVKLKLNGQALKYKFSQDYTEWSDIVKNVTIFITKEYDLFDTKKDAICKYVPNSTILNGDPTGYHMTGNSVYIDGAFSNTDVQYLVLESNPDTDLVETIKDGVYYKLCEIGTNGDGTWHDAGEHFGSHVLETLTTQDQLGDDDYYSHCPFKPGMIYAYNSRLNLANVFRGFFEGFDNFMPYDGSSAVYTYKVTIATDGGDVVISHTSPSTTQVQGLYFYYPDARAKHVTIKQGSTVILSTKLTEHTRLNGAYYFHGIVPVPPQQGYQTASIKIDNLPDDGTDPTVTSPTPFEFLPNTIITSEVNNPYVFKAKGYNNVGTGKVIGMSTITQALSEGQFGQYPLLVFSTEGIWALSVDNEGMYSSVHPMSREVALEDNPCLTQTDGAVFFASKKGLMVVVGSQVKCVSEQLSGETGNFTGITDLGNFINFLSSAIIAYDYRDSLLWIFDKTHSACWIYSIKSGTFGKYNFSAAVTNVVNYYPDFLLQNSQEILSLLQRTDINSDSYHLYSGTIISRPMKLENALALKSIMQVKHINKFSPYNVTDNGVTTQTKGTITLRIFASNDLDHWVELASLRGVPWKYYRFRYNFANLKATDRFSGTMLVTQERRTDKLR